MNTKNLVIFLIILGLILPNFSFAQQPPIKAPETLEETKEMGKKALEVSEKELPDILKKIWKEEVLPIWQKMYNWFFSNIWLKIKNWFKEKVKPKVKKEMKKRKSVIKEEFKKEKEEIKKDIKEQTVPKAVKSLWEKFKELIK